MKAAVEADGFLSQTSSLDPTNEIAVWTRGLADNLGPHEHPIHVLLA